MDKALTKEEVAYVAHLARLEMTDAELDKYTSQLSAILGFVDQLQEVDTEGIEPLAQTTGLVNVLQDDATAADKVDREALLKGAPASEAPYVKVKAVLEND